MIKNIIIFILLATTTLKAQLEKNVQLEVVGRPTWQMLIPLEDNGVLLMVKTDLTKINFYNFDSDLNKRWEKEVFLDAEAPPKAYTLTGNGLSLMFSETSGMYYQVFQFDLQTGNLSQSGFELREFFVDQDYVFLGDKVIMAGSNEKGAAFYTYHIDKNEGALSTKEGIEGKVAVNSFQYNPGNGTIEALWSVKTIGYANEKKKKGPFTKDAFLVHALLDTLGNTIVKNEIKQSGGKFPVNGKIVNLSNGDKVIMGNYQSNAGDKGVFLYNMTTNTGLNTFSYSQLLRGNVSLTAKEMTELMTTYDFIPNQPIEGDNKILYGGVFMKPQFQTVTQQSPFYNNGSPYGYGSNRYGYNTMNNRNSTTKQIFQGYHYPLGFLMELTPEGNLLSSNRVDINNLSKDMLPALAYNEKGSVSYCVNGNLATKNYQIGTKPILYKLSNETVANAKTANAAFLPAYTGVQFWYDNYFIAEGSRSKIEAISINDKLSSKPAKKGLFGRKKNNTPDSYSQVRKIIYLTKIASGI